MEVALGFTYSVLGDIDHIYLAKEKVLPWQKI